MIWTINELHAIEMMSKHGGGFVQTLALLCIRADATNADRIRSAFACYFSEYSNVEK